MTLTYHERIAHAMKKTYIVGSLNSYKTILDALHRKFPTERELREHVSVLEHIVRTTGTVPDSWTLLNETEKGEMHDGNKASS